MMRAVQRGWWAVLLCLGLTACSTTQESVVQVLPTLAATAVPQGLTLDAAQQVALNFLEAWRNQDYTTMHQLTSIATQESTPLAEFTALYQSVSEDLTLTALAYQPMNLAQNPQNPQIVTLNYNVTFLTRLLGSFDDPNRTLTLLYDARGDGQRPDGWRVAWSAADLFAELGSGGVLRLERNIPQRANIRDRQGEMLADQNGIVVVVRLVKAEMPAPEACMATLSTALGQPLEQVQARLAELGDTWLADVGTLETERYLAAREGLVRDCAAQFDNRAVRRYLNGALMPHIVGVVGYPSEAQVATLEQQGFAADSIIGQSGIEQSWDETLRGQPGARLVINTRGGQRLRVLAERTSQPGQSVWLTVDYALQQFILQTMFEAYRDNAWAATSKGASAIVIDVNTGEVLAMVSFPTYDANAFSPFPSMGAQEGARIVNEVTADPRRPLLNRPAQGVYPAGSVFKIADTLAVLDSGVFEADKRFGCGGVWERDGVIRTDWLPGGHGTVTPSSALTQSCNPFYYEVGYQMNARDPYLLPRYARSYGLGMSTGMTDIAESVGNIGDPDWLQRTYGTPWTFADAVSLSIGQGAVEVTPLQIVRMTAMVANGGTLHRPQLVYQAGLLGETPSYTLTPAVVDTVAIDPAALALVRDAMCNVTSTPSGTAQFVFGDSSLQEIGICGKTGTAQDLTSPNAASHAWFTAYAPRENPQIAIVVMVENSGEGSGVAAPLVRKILEYYFSVR
jgi:penicillin-binding protein 2